jgi:hypothetical protein
MIGLGLIQLECPSETVEDFGRNPGEVAPFHPRVILHADAGQHCDLLTPQTPDPAAPAANDPRLSWCDPVPARTQELRDVSSLIHALHSRS